ncbi:hypothetical protein ACFW5D_31590 [Streptomyces sp. NPDC058770]|uniref:hypothetical protein n=1 Tax=Streptomyces sp. NPDC058770 TaxID=3346631 RepID=UPI00367FFEDD
MVSTDERVGTPDERVGNRDADVDDRGAAGADAAPGNASDETVGAGEADGAKGSDKTGRTEDAKGPDGADGTDDAKGPDGATRSVHRRILAGAAVLLTVALLAAGAGLFVKARQLRDTPATDNLALTDSAATTRVIGDVSNALGTVFSYGPRETDATKESAKRYLDGKALQQYAALFGQVEKEARDQELTLTTHVVRAGVTRLTGTGAHLLVFLDQVYERRGRAATTAAAQLSVTAELRGGHWRIVDIAAR